MIFSRRVLGLDVGSSSVKVVQLSISPGGRRIWAKSSLLEDKSHLVQLLSQKEWKRKTDPVHASFPSHQVLMRSVTMPFRDPQKIRQALPFELEREVPFGAEEMLAGYFPQIISQQEGTTVLAVAAPKTAVAARLEELRGLGLDPAVLEPEVTSLARVFAPLAQENAGSFAVLEAGASKANLLVFQGGSLRAARAIPRGLGMGPEAVSEELSVEISRTLRALKARGEASDVQVLYACGGLAERSLELKQLASQWDLTVQTLDPFTIWASHVSHCPGIHPARFSTTLGLALCGLHKATANSNLRFGEFGYRPGMAAMKGKMLAAGVLFVVALGLALAHLQARVVMRQKQLEALQKETRRLFREVLPEVTQVVDPVVQMQRLLEERKSRHLTLLAQDPRTTALELLREISVREQAKTLRITELDMTAEGVNIRGEASAYDVVEKAKDHWSASPLLEGVEIKHAKKNPKTQLWDFQLTARRRAS